MADTQASVDYLNKVVEQKPPNRNARWHRDKKDWVAEHSAAAKATVADSRKTQAWLNAEMDAAKATTTTPGLAWPPPGLALGP